MDPYRLGIECSEAQLSNRLIAPEPLCGRVNLIRPTPLATNKKPTGALGDATIASVPQRRTLSVTRGEEKSRNPTGESILDYSMEPGFEVAFISLGPFFHYWRPLRLWASSELLVTVHRL